ncbi:hypothetical protein [Streptomyces sp. NBC_01803]|uniref:hypothetical protein n=1 Tax=Streptomyces sp. NBC_01803 TaxID=2975946 RepID=UPI002DDA4276|nr:hypothetical protein [Streptomyces sp. NBC_01803]WSA45657.1 hypothetical protein OIE51_16480 [Streptomyces sp. NBC_01803]
MSTSQPQSPRTPRTVGPVGPVGPDGPDDEPRPDPIRFYGTSWVEHTDGYAVRRAGLAVGTLLLTAAGALVLWLGYLGLRDSGTAGWLRALVVLAFVVCAVMAFMRTWAAYARPADNAVDESAFRSIKVVGFVGVLLAYALRTLVEAPGEKLRRMDYDEALTRHLRLTAKRSRNPARRKRRTTS